jgi:hypothetical protein
MSLPTLRRRGGVRSQESTIVSGNLNLDPGIRDIVERLQALGVETYESCQGGQGHPFPEPTVRFHGDHMEGFRVLALAIQHGLKVGTLRRHYQIISGEPHGPEWEMTFTIPGGNPVAVPKRAGNGGITWRWK